jgi:hypothetical protein
MGGRYFAEECAYFRRCYVGFVRHWYAFMGDGIDRTQDVPSLPTTGCAYAHACETPEVAKITVKHEMCCINKINNALIRVCFD